MDWTQHHRFAEFTPAMADACISELRIKADLYERTGLIPVMDCSGCAIKSDSLLDEDLVSALKAAVAPLEDVPDDRKDWHPRSDNKVLDLVHPSLWPLVYGRSRVLTDRRLDLTNALSHCGTGTIIPAQDYKRTFVHGGHPESSLSLKFQWLPCDVLLTDGRPKINSYINNLHPVDHAPLYPIIERFIEKALPAWDLVYRWPEEFDLQRLTCNDVYPECGDAEACERSDCYPENRPLEEGEPPREEDESLEDAYEGSLRQKLDFEWYHRTHKLKIEDPDTDAGYFKVQPSDVKTGGFFEDASRIQVIVKLANIHLTPDKPTYDGGTWHVEGQLNEHIVGTALFYYDSDNITDCHLDFRTVADREELSLELSYMQGDEHNISRAFAIDPSGDAIQDIGSVLTRPGRALFFPNLYQHHVSPFSLADPTRPGHRKILALFLVDPAIPIVSTANVPPQQYHWWARETRLGNGRLGPLPPEVKNMVLDQSDWPIEEKEAKQTRENLMDERTVLVQESEDDLRLNTFSFCEH